MRGMQATGGLTPQQGSFLRNIREHSTPLNVNGANSSNRKNNSNKKRAKKRKLVDGRDIIDLTPKKFRLSSNDSDIEIIEPEPPTIIDLVADETYSCNALTTVNTIADTAADPTADTTADTTAESTTTSNSLENENAISNISVNNDVSVIVDSSESSELRTSMEASIVIETEKPKIEPVPLYVKDVTGVTNIDPPLYDPPLYDLVSDDSFCFDSPFATPLSSQDFSWNKTLTNADDSVIFVSETIKPRNKVPLSRSEDFIPINHRGGFNRPVRSSRFIYFCWIHFYTKSL